MSLTFDQALERVRELHADPLCAVHAARVAGRKIVGLVGPTIPVELVLAAGCLPVMLTGRGRQTLVGDRFMEPLFEPELREIFDGLLTGGYGHLDMVVVPRSADQYNKLYLYLREAQRLGHGNDIPRMEFYDILHTQTTLSQKYGLERTRELAADLSEVGDQPVDDASVTLALKDVNRLRTALRAFQAAREEGRLPLSGADAQRVLSARRFDEPAAVAALIEAIVAEAGESKGVGPRILIKGFPLHHVALHEMVEQAGGVVVAEDDWWGARAAEDDVEPQSLDDGAISAVFEAVFRDGYSIRTEPRAARERWYNAWIAGQRIDGVLFYIPPFDDVSGWDYPGQRNLALGAGLSQCRVDEDAQAVEHRSDTQAIIERFVADMKAKLA